MITKIVKIACKIFLKTLTTTGYIFFTQFSKNFSLRDPQYIFRYRKKITTLTQIHIVYTSIEHGHIIFKKLFSKTENPKGGHGFSRQMAMLDEMIFFNDKIKKSDGIKHFKVKMYIIKKIMIGSRFPRNDTCKI